MLSDACPTSELRTRAPVYTMFGSLPDSFSRPVLCLISWNSPMDQVGVQDSTSPYLKSLSKYQNSTIYHCDKLALTNYIQILNNSISLYFKSSTNK